MNIPASIADQVESRIKRCMKESGIYVRRLQIKYDITSANTYGEARYGWMNLIRINPVYLLAHGDEFIKHIVTHEYAHLAAFRKSGLNISPHGPEWKAVMRSMGVEPQRCYTFAVPAGYTVGPRSRLIKV